MTTRLHCLLLAIGMFLEEVSAVGAGPTGKPPDLTVPAPTATNRVTAAALVFPATVNAGDSVTVLVKVRVAAGHYIYALEKSGTMNLPTQLEATSGGILHPTGPWRGPEPKLKEDGSRTYSGEVLFQREFQVEREPPTHNCKISIKLKFQVCNEALCWPPATLPLETALKVRQP